MLKLFGLLAGLVAVAPVPAPPPCGGANVEKIGMEWQAELRLGDWRVEYRCEIPERYKASHRGLSAADTNTREALVLVNPDISDPSAVSEVVLHELLHVLLFELKEAKSEKVDEQIVRALSEIILKERQASGR